MGLKDKVNNHYLQIFGTSIALGVIAGASEIELGGGALTGSGSQLFATGASSSISSSATSKEPRLRGMRMSTLHEAAREESVRQREGLWI